MCVGFKRAGKIESVPVQRAVQLGLVLVCDLRSMAVRQPSQKLGWKESPSRHFGYASDPKRALVQPEVTEMRQPWLEAASGRVGVGRGNVVEDGVL